MRNDAKNGPGETKDEDWIQEIFHVYLILSPLSRLARATLANGSTGQMRRKLSVFPVCMKQIGLCFD